MNKDIHRNRWRSGRIFLALICCALLSAAPGDSQVLDSKLGDGRVHSNKSRRLWKISMGVLAAVSIADASTSWNRMEANPLLQGPNGRFGTRGLSLKMALVGSALTAQLLLARNPSVSVRSMTVVNLSMSGLLAGAAAHNIRTARPVN
jgi:hypothetical protein